VKWRRWSPWGIAVWAATVAFVALYGWLILDMHAAFATQTFDFGIYDQGLWLLSRFKEPFITLRGLNLFGDHASLIMIPMAPLFWVADDPRALLLFTVAALAAGGPLVYAIGRRSDLPPPLAAALAGGFLLYPALTWATWWNFHPELAAIPLMLGSFLLAAQRRPRLSAALLVAVLLVKEDAALVVVPMALWFGLARPRMWSLRQSLIVAVVGIAFFVFEFTVLLPAFSPTGELIYVGRYARFGDTMPEAFVGMIVHPMTTLSVLFSARSIAYLARMLLPLPTCLLRPSILLVAAPITAANLLSGQLGQQDIKFHYAAYLTAVVAIAAVLGAARLRQWLGDRADRPAMVVTVGAGLLAIALVANVAWSPSPIGVERRQWFGPDVFDERRAEHLAEIPDNAVVSADPFIAPHLAHRTTVYMFPNPFAPLAWGAGGLPPLPDTDTVEWVALRPVAYPLGSEGSVTVDELRTSDVYEVVVDDGDLLLLRRRNPAEPAP
jgi:uncharacterized membrane protein